MTLFTDLFNRADTPAGSGLGAVPEGPAWEVVSGSWRILGQRAHTDTPAASRPIAVITTESASFDQTLNVGGLGGDALYARVLNASNWLCARVRRWGVTQSGGYTEYLWEQTVQTGTPPVTEYEWARTYELGITHDNKDLYGLHTDLAWGTSPTSSPLGYATRQHRHYLAGTYYPGDDTEHYHPYRLVWHTGNTRIRPGTGYSTTTNYAWSASNTYSPFGGGNARLTGQTRYQNTSYTQVYTQVVVERAIDGAVAEVGTTPATTGAAPSTVRFIGTGDRLEVRLNGSSTAAFTGTNATHRAVTRHGIGRAPSDLTGGAVLDTYVHDTLNTPPRAPTLTVPAVVNVLSPLILSPRFSDPDPGDSARETYLRIRRSDLGGATPPEWTVIRRLGSDTAVTVPLSYFTAQGEGEYEVAGAHRDAGGLPTLDADLKWSTPVRFLASTPAEGLAFSSPPAGERIPASSYSFALAVADDYDLIEWRVLRDLNGTPDTSRVVTSGSTAGLAFTATGLSNGTTVHVQARAIKDTLPTDWLTQSHPVAFTPPVTPVLSVAVTPWALAVTILNRAPVASQPTTLHNRLRRRVVGSSGPGDLLKNYPLDAALEVPRNGTHLDQTARHGVAYEYQAEAAGDNGTIVLSEWYAGLTDFTRLDEGAFADTVFAVTDYH